MDSSLKKFYIIAWAFGLIFYFLDYVIRSAPAVMIPQLVNNFNSMFVLGLGSGAAMIPYSVIKEANPDYVKGSATGAINFITFGVTTLLSPIFSRWFGKSLDISSGDLHFQHSILFWISGIVLAILISLMLKETGSKAQNQAIVS